MRLLANPLGEGSLRLPILVCFSFAIGVCSILEGLIGAWYYLGVTAGIAAVVLLRGRWKTSWGHVLLLGVFWPIALALSYWIVRTEEEDRRQRILHEVMDS